MRMSKKGQEEMVGFALIVIIVFVALLFLLMFTLRQSNKQGVESYEVESFLQAVLQQTSTCEQNSRLVSVGSLVTDCVEQRVCDSGVEACQALNETLIPVLDLSWPHGQDRPVKGYEMSVVSSTGELFRSQVGNSTEAYKGAVQNIPGAINVSFRVYYG